MNEQTRKYRIRNGRAYNAAWVNRGSLTVWLDEAALARWHATERTGRRSAPKRDSDWAVQWGLVMRAVFHGPLRALEGLPRSLRALLRVTLNTSDDSTFSRQAAARTVWIGRRVCSQPRHVVIDATGLKVHGEGEWGRCASPERVGVEPGASGIWPWMRTPTRSSPLNGRRPSWGIRAIALYQHNKLI